MLKYFATRLESGTWLNNRRPLKCADAGGDVL
jgi:hypothetical protein